MHDSIECFDFSWDGGEPEATGEEILQLKEMKILNPGTFRIVNPRLWYGVHFEIIIDIFRHFAERKILWKELQLRDHRDIYEEDGEIDLEGMLLQCRLFYILLLTANSFSLFKYIVIDVTGAVFMPVLHSTFECMLNGVNLNNRLESICVHGALLGGDYGALKSLLQASSSLKSLTLHISDFDMPLLCQALEGNKTLKEIRLGFIEKSHSELITVLAALPKLETLLLILSASTELGYEHDYSESIKTLLLSSSSLTNLSLLHRTGETCLSIEPIVQGLRETQTLSVFLLSGVKSNFVFSTIFDVLSSCPSLTTMAFGQYIAKDDLKRATTLGRLSKPLKIRLGGAHYDQFVEDLLCAHPELLLQVHDEDFLEGNVESPSFELTWKLNWNGRYLLDHLNVPLALWVYVLQRANDMPSVMFELLLGPAFAARERIE
jgi:hypothetical protein